MYTKFLLTILTVLSFMTVAYCKFAEPQTIEPFAGLMYRPFGAVKQTVVSNGDVCFDTWPYNNVQNPVSSTEVVLPSMNSPPGNNMAPYTTAAMAADQLAEASGVTEQYVPNQQQSTNGLNNPGCTQEGYTGPNNFYTVPGTFQSELSPRFMNEGFGADITYNFPEQRHLAAEPDNPLSLANDVENFEQQQHENYENVETKFAQVHEPVPLPRTMDGPEREDYGALGPHGKQPMLGPGGEQHKLGPGGSPPNPGAAIPQFKVYDRLITVTGNNGYNNNNTNSSDVIRGDLAILPSAANCGWFMSRYASPASLRTGALDVLGGSSESTKDMAELKMAYTTATTGSGVSYDGYLDQNSAKSALKHTVDSTNKKMHQLSSATNGQSVSGVVVGYS
jgi:hypothetical protein